MAAEFTWLPFLLQTADALFPTGAYAHSLGLEEIVRLGIVRDERTLCAFLRDQTAPSLINHELPYLRYAYAAATRHDMAELCELDHEISAWKPARETREASIQLGLRRLRALLVIATTPTSHDGNQCGRGVPPLMEPRQPGALSTGESRQAHTLLAQFSESVEAGKGLGHHLVVCGLQGAVQEVPLEATLQAYFYQALASVCSAALKLIRIGQDGVQRALHSATTLVPAGVERSLAVAREDAGWFNPLLEIASMRHERANERLFIS